MDDEDITWYECQHCQRVFSNEVNVRNHFMCTVFMSPTSRVSKEMRAYLNWGVLSKPKQFKRPAETEAMAPSTKFVASDSDVTDSMCEVS